MTNLPPLDVVNRYWMLVFSMVMIGTGWIAQMDSLANSLKWKKDLLNL